MNATLFCKILKIVDVKFVFTIFEHDSCAYILNFKNTSLLVVKYRQ